jgi:hypothetical protein
VIFCFKCFGFFFQNLYSLKPRIFFILGPFWVI